MNKINKQNGNRLIETTDRQLSEGRGVGGLGEIGKEIKQKENLIDTDNSMVITRGKGGWGRERRV